MKNSKATIKLQQLYALKLEHQHQENVLDNKKRIWRELSTEIRSRSQELSKLKAKILKEIEVL